MKIKWEVSNLIKIYLKKTFEKNRSIEETFFGNCKIKDNFVNLVSGAVYYFGFKKVYFLR